MRKLIIILLLALTGQLSAQVDYFTLTKDDGTLIGAVVHRAPVNSYGHKDPIIVWCHGQEANASAPANVNDTARIVIVTGKGTIKLVKTSPLPLVHKPGGGPMEYYRYNVVAGQNRSGLWDCEIIKKVIAWARTQSATMDTSLIVLIGYSLGGGACQSCLNQTGIREYVKYVVIIAPGYTNSPNFAVLGTSAINMDVFACIGDQLAAPTGTRADYFVGGVKATSPKVVPNYWRLNDISPTNNPTDHDKMVMIIAEDTTSGDTYGLTNGDTWTRSETIYERGLRFFGPKRLEFLFIVIPMRRRKRRKAA